MINAKTFLQIQSNKSIAKTIYKYERIDQKEKISYFFVRSFIDLAV